MAHYSVVTDSLIRTLQCTPNLHDAVFPIAQ